MDGFSYYVSQMWKQILDAKDLDLPGERTLAATHRCQQIKLESIKKVEP
jgi:hypothetical protein